MNYKINYQFIGHLVSNGITATDLKILALLENHEQRLSVEFINSEIGKSKKYIYRAMDRLIKAGLVTYENRNRTRHYALRRL